MTQLRFAERILQVDHALGDVPHAFGGAIALAYYAEPRATIDMDINIFLPQSEYEMVASRLTPLTVSMGDSETAAIATRDGQVRVFWDDVPIDLFFSYDPFHDAAEKARRTVPFAADTIEILSADHLFVCKVVFNRPKDWVDIDAMIESGTDLDAAEALRWIIRIVGDQDRRYERAVAVLRTPRG